MELHARYWLELPVILADCAWALPALRFGWSESSPRIERKIVIDCLMEGMGYPFPRKDGAMLDLNPKVAFGG